MSIYTLIDGTSVRAVAIGHPSAFKLIHGSEIQAAGSFPVRGQKGCALPIRRDGYTRSVLRSPAFVRRLVDRETEFVDARCGRGPRSLSDPHRDGDQQGRREGP